MTRHLAGSGHDVVSYARHHAQDSSQHTNVRNITGDLRDCDTLADAMRNADVVYHFATGTHPSLFYTDPGSECRESLEPLMKIIEVASDVGVKKIVFPSSGGTIYRDSDSPCSEDSPTCPNSPYAIFKLAAEQLLIHAARSGNFSVDVFRIGNPYGPGQRPRPGQGVLPHWIDAIRKNQPIKVFGDGSAKRDYVFIDDVCRLMSLSLFRLRESQTFNLGTGRATSLVELIQHLQSLVREPIEVALLDGRESDIRSIVLSPERLLRLAPDFCFTPIREGIRRTLQFHGLAN